MRDNKVQAKVRYVRNEQGPVLGYSEASGIRILEADGRFFKDLNRNGVLDPYEDWRLPPEERARDLAARMSIEQIAGLMLYSSHQAVPANLGWFPGTYDGRPYGESGAAPSDLTDQQMRFITEDHVRHVLVTRLESPEVAARWTNNLQALAESIGLGIPVNISSDPRHSADDSKEFNAGAGDRISRWPESLGLAATFDPETARRFGEVAAREYRALGITTALSPQIDIATEPRWFRFGMTFGEDSRLAADMARAYVDGMQTSTGDREIAGGWGYDSVNAMVKHWPGGGSGEGGRDSHFGVGKFNVYPGDNFAEHLIPFTEGAFKLDGPTGKASAVMPYYSISWGQDRKYGENVGNSYSRYMITDLLRTEYGYDGVVCTDWGITADEGPDVTRLFPGGRCWGVEENHTVAERHLKILLAGVDQFGGNNEIAPILEAYRIGCERYGEAYMRARFEQSAIRLLLNIFRLGLFENPYLDEQRSAAVVACPEYVAAGYEAQLKSIVMLKNAGGILPLQKGSKVYIPKRYRPASTDWFGNTIPEYECDPVQLDVVRRYFDVTDHPDEADYALVFIESPHITKGYSHEDKAAGGNGYMPISLQYRPYTAEHARETSIAGDPREVLNRSYRGKTVTTPNASDLDAVLETRKRMKDKPVIVSILLSNPAVMAEFEGAADAILAHFSVQDSALLDIITGAAEPSALLPMQLPAHMRTVEEQFEDVAHDMEVYVDSEGNRYDFGFGLNWSGRIQDERTARYVRRAPGSASI